MKKAKFVGIGVMFILLLSAIGTGEVNIDSRKEGTGSRSVNCINPESINIPLYFSNPTSDDNGNYTSIKVNGAEYGIADGGTPYLPTYRKVLTFSFGTKIESIDVELGNIQTMHLDKKIAPAPEPVPLNGAVPTEAKEGKIYESSELYPSNWVEWHTGAGIENGEHVIFLSIHAFPARYIPSTNELEYVNEMSIEINYVPPEEPMPTKDVYDLLIVAPSEFSDELQPLMEHKESYDMKTILVSLDEIYNGNYFTVQGRDDAEKIKYFIKDSIEQWGIKYVMLVGDIEKMPCRKVWSFWGGEQMYSDQYYADIYDANMSFCSWDSNGNDRFGETSSDDGTENDFVDLYSDVYVGRWACYDKEETSTVVNKTIHYEETAYGKEWFNKLILMGGDTFPWRNDIAEGEIVNEYVEQATPDFNHVKIQTSLHNFLPNKINNAMTEGSGFISYSGHGFEYGFGTYPKNSLWMIAYYTPYLLALKNSDKLPIAFFDACLTAKLDYHMLGNSDIPCLAWCMVKKPDGGAIATVGATETATTTVDENGPHGQAGYMNLHFFMAYETGIHVSEMLVKAQNDYLNDIIDDKANDRFYVMTIEQFILLGDPSLKVGGYQQE
ncbi:MAG: C25 family cysteine peptidase [Candidatus Thermoplasmatota archaeon]|nr:C25 family cysteine peptidase [Candidatus Thermoplasmatota archaeon]